MPPMQDRDFDQLFNQRFEAFEVKPSAKLWQRITNDLDKPSRNKRNLSTYWMAAASIIVLVLAGLWLYKPAEVIQLQGKSENQVAISKEKSVANMSEADQLDASEAIRPASSLAVWRAESIPKVSRRKSRKVNTADSDVDSSPNKITVSAPAVNAAHAIASVNNSLNIVEKSQHVEAPQVGAAQLEKDEKEDTRNERTKTPKIKSIGGLVNFVIAQLDKREDKIIEFRDGDEGAEVSGINIGPLKFKSKNK